MDPNTIIDALGGTFETAKLCEVKPGAVSQWRKNGIPNARLMFLKAVRPEVFARLAQFPDVSKVGKSDPGKQ